MNRPRSTLIFIVLLALGLFAAVPAEDLPETAYDESDDVSYVSTAMSAEVMPALASQAAPGALPLQSTTRSPATAEGINGTDAHRSAEGRVAPALRCVLCC
jgi:hypothetical protein